MSPLLLLLAAAQPAGAQDSRDDEIFGSSAQSLPDQAEEETPAPLEGGPLKTDAEIAARLQQQDTRLAIGGLGYLRANTYLAEGQEVGQVDLDSPSFVDLYADARPTDRLRLYTRGRLSHDLTILSGDVSPYGEELQPTRVALDQLWLNLDIGHTVFVTADHHRFTLTGISNLSDNTVVGRFDWAANVLTELSVNAYAQVHGGPAGGEFAFAVEVPPIPGVLDKGLTVTRPLVDLGLGAQVRF